MRIVVLFFIVATYSVQLYSQENKMTLKQCIETGITKKQVERMDVMVKEGASGNYLLADLKGQLATEEISIINSANAVEQAKLNLCQLMNIDYNSKLQLERDEASLSITSYAASSSDIYNTALQQFALIRANELRVKSAEKALKVSRSGFYPTISLNGNLFSSYSSLAETLTPTTTNEVQTGSYVIINGIHNPVLKQEQNYSSTKTAYTKQLNNNIGTYFGVNMQIPLFNSFQSRNQVKLSNLSLKNTELESENSKTQLKREIEQAHLNMTSSYD